MFTYSFQIFEASEKESITSAEEGDASSSDEDEDSPENKYLFCSNVPMGKSLALGFVIVASHDRNFGKLYLRILSGKRKMLIRNYSKFLHLFSVPLAEKKELLGKNGFYGIGDITISFTNDGSMSLITHSKTFGGDVNFVALSPEELEFIETSIETLLVQRLPFEMVEKVTNEAIIDIKAECRMEAMGNCNGCKEMGSNHKPHICTSMLGGRLDSVLRRAMSTKDKWPFSRAIEQIYTRLKKHVVYFKQEFRHSVAWNKHLHDLHKTADLPPFMFLE